MPGDARTLLVVIFLRVAHGVELGSASQHAATKPDSVSLHVVTDHVDVDRLWLDSSLAELFGELQARLNDALQVALQTPREILEHGRAAAQDDVLVKRSAHVDRAILHDRVDGLGDGCGKVGVGELRVEEDLWAEEALVADVDLPWLLCHWVAVFVGFQPLVGCDVVLVELLGNIRADVAIPLLNAKRTQMIDNCMSIRGGLGF